MAVLILVLAYYGIMDYGLMDYGIWIVVCCVSTSFGYFTLLYYIIAFRFSADGNVALAHGLPVLNY